MLQTPRPSNIDDQTSPSEQSSIGEVIQFIIGFIWRQYVVILAGLLVCLATGITYLLLTHPSYTATAEITVEPRKSQFLQQSLLGEPQFDLEGQILILKSESIASAVIRDLHLLNDPEFTGTSRGIASRARDILGYGSPEQPKSDANLMREAVAALQARTEAKRIPGSAVIEVSFRSASAERAAEIANAIADAFIRDQQDAKLEANRRASEWLEDRMRGLLEQASAADRAVAAFKRENNIVSADGKLINDQQLTDFNARLVAARARTSETQARLSRIQSVIRSDKPDATVDPTVSDALNNPIITRLRQQYLDLVNREADFSNRYGANHQATVQLRNQIRDIRESILEELRRVAETYKSDYEIAKQQQDELEKELGKVVLQSQLTNRAQVKLRELESAAQSYRTLYDNYLRQHTQAVEQQTFPLADLRVISHAAVPLTKSHPKTLLVLAFSLFSGLCLGGGIGLLRELMDRVFRTRDQVEKALQIPCVAMVPVLIGEEQQYSFPTKQPSSAIAGPRIIVPDSGAMWALVNAPSSHFAEAIRSIKLAADISDLSGTNRPNQVIGFTSTLPNEGKSTLAAAFAELAAQVRGRVIIVDCDLRNPSLSRALAPEATVGIVEVISGQRPLEEAVWRETKTNISFLPVAREADLYHTSEILGSDWTKRLFDELRQRYDYVIVDLPPLAPLVDVRATSRFVDGYFLVIEWGQTKVDVVEHALNSAQNIYDHLIGVVLNKTDMKSLKRYEFYRSSYYYNKKFARYGYAEEYGAKD